MDFELTDEQKMITESVDKLLSDQYDFQSRCKRLSSNERFDLSIWQQFARLGLLGMPLPTEYGGFSASISDLSVLMEPMGSSLVVEPFLYCTLGSWLLSQTASKAIQKRYFSSIVSGETRVVVAMRPICSTAFMPSHQEVTAIRDKDNRWRLSGACHMVYGADAATHVIVFARCGKRDMAFMLPLSACQRKSFSLVDDTGVCHISLDNVLCDADHELKCNRYTQDRIMAAAVCLLSSEAVSIMRVLNQKSKDYLQQRKQFGQPLSSFQVLQHRLVEMYVQEELARSLSLALALSMEDVKQMRQYMSQVSMTKLKINDYSQFVGEQAVQLHGGMGVSDEMDIAHYFRRLTCIRHQFGDQAYHVSKLSAMFKRGL
jgi:alkylation response protein AidB-like acyl-CoA dehydrogenase